MSWRCTIIDPATQRDAYVRFHYGPVYEIAIPSSGNVFGDKGIVETAKAAHELAKALVAGDPSREYLFTVQPLETAYVVQFYGGPEVCVRIYVGREADAYAHGMFQKSIKTHEKPKAKRHA